MLPAKILRHLLLLLGIDGFAYLIVAFCLADKVDECFGDLGVEVLHDVLFLCLAKVC